jgi:DNA-binding NtrC family response regulator
MHKPIVVIDDHPEHLLYLTLLLRRAGHEVRGFSCARHAFDEIAAAPPALVVTDVFMPDMDGIEVVRLLRRNHPSIAVIGIGGFGRELGPNYLSAMRALGAAATFKKPINERLFLAEVDRLTAPSAVP